MKRYVLGLSALILFAGCTPQLPKGEKSTYNNEYKRTTNNKAFVIAMKNGHYVRVYTGGKDTKEEAINGALETCKKVVSDHHILKADDCIVYDVNGQVQ